MNIQDYIEKIKSFIGKLSRAEYIGTITVILVAVISYNLGILTSYNKSNTPVIITSNIVLDTNLDEQRIEKTEERKYVGSKTSNKYHLPWCSGAQRIKEENKIWFSSQKDAEVRGYIPAKNCPGI